MNKLQYLDRASNDWIGTRCYTQKIMDIAELFGIASRSSKYVTIKFTGFTPAAGVIDIKHDETRCEYEFENLIEAIAILQVYA